MGAAAGSEPTECVAHGGGGGGGRYLNEQRLSQTGVASAPFKIVSGDVLRLGLDVEGGGRPRASSCLGPG